VRSPAETEAWLSSIDPPTRYSHVKAIFHITFYSKREPVKTAEWVEAALQEYPDRPEVLKLGLYHYDVVNDQEKRLRAPSSSLRYYGLEARQSWP
jgi:hypothetical protein